MSVHGSVVRMHEVEDAHMPAGNVYCVHDTSCVSFEVFFVKLTF